MEMQQFIEKLLAAAKEQGIDPAEAYVNAGTNFSADVMQGSIDTYSVSDKLGLGLRGIYQGKMGYASTQAFDDEAIKQLIEGVKEGASLREDEDVEEIYAGDASSSHRKQLVRRPGAGFRHREAGRLPEHRKSRRFQPAHRDPLQRHALEHHLPRNPDHATATG